MKWYTAIGVKTNHYDGKFHVRIGKTEEKVLSGMEIYLWTSLLWAFTEEDDIYNRMKKLLYFAYPEEEKKETDKEEFQFCFRRLCIRGLVIYCEGDRKEAAAEVLRKTTVELTIASFHDRYINFLTSAVHGNGIRFSLRAFKKNPLEKRHRDLLERLKKQGGIPLYIEEIHAEGRKDGQDADEICRREKEFLDIVADLYKKKILMIRAVNRGGVFEQYTQ